MMTHIFYSSSDIDYKRASLACAPRVADTLCPQGAPFGPRITLINYKMDSISKHVCLTVIIELTRKITKFVKFINF